jgi:mycoredoxin
MDVKLYSSQYCGDCRAAKRFLDSHGIRYTVVNVDEDDDAAVELIQHVGKRAVPHLVIDGEWFQPYQPGMGLLYDELKKRFGITQ